MIDRGIGTPVVLMPGIQGRWEWMAPAVDALADRFRVVTFSLCDEPTSGFRFEPGRGIDNYLQQVDEALDRAGLDAAILIGVCTADPSRRNMQPGGLTRARAGARVGAAARLGAESASALLPASAALAEPAVSPGFAGARAARNPGAQLPRFGPAVRFMAGQLPLVLRAFVSPSRMAARLRWNEAYQFEIHRPSHSRCSSSPVKTASIASSHRI